MKIIHQGVVRQKKRMKRGGDLAPEEKPKHRTQKFRSEWLTDCAWIEQDADELKGVNFATSLWLPN